MPRVSWLTKEIMAEILGRRLVSFGKLGELTMAIKRARAPMTAGGLR